MTKNDNDMMLMTMVFWYNLKEWRNSKDTELPPKDQKKLDMVCDTLMQLFTQFKKREGSDVFDAFLESSKGSKFYVTSIDDPIYENITGTFQATLDTSLIKKILEKADTECFLCQRDNFVDCEWYALHNILTPNKGCCKKCPYKKDSLF